MQSAGKRLSRRLKTTAKSYWTVGSLYQHYQSYRRSGAPKSSSGHFAAAGSFEVALMWLLCTSTIPCAVWQQHSMDMNFQFRPFAPARIERQFCTESTVPNWCSTLAGKPPCVDRNPGSVLIPLRVERSPRQMKATKATDDGIEYMCTMSHAHVR